MTEVVQVTRGNPVSLECRLTGTPQIRVSWTKDGKELKSSRKHQLSYKNNHSSLTVKSSQMEDGGEYLFEATNSVGTCSCKVMLRVLGLSKEQISCRLVLFLSLTIFLLSL